MESRRSRAFVVRWFAGARGHRHSGDETRVFDYGGSSGGTGRDEFRSRSGPSVRRSVGRRSLPDLRLPPAGRPLVPLSVRRGAPPGGRRPLRGRCGSRGPDRTVLPSTEILPFGLILFALGSAFLPRVLLLFWFLFPTPVGPLYGPHLFFPDVRSSGTAFRLAPFAGHSSVKAGGFR